MPLLSSTLSLTCFLWLTFTLSSLTIASPVTLLIPSQPNVEIPKKSDTQENNSPNIPEEIDILISMMKPFQHEGLSMDMPQLFAVLHYDKNTPEKDGYLIGERKDLLGDIEQIMYLNQKAWGANVALPKPGLYQFIIESRPWWDEENKRFIQHLVKTVLPVYGVERGWDQFAGQVFEILPLTRPFGLSSPNMFTGQALLQGVPIKNTIVTMNRINIEDITAPTPWHEEMIAKTDNDGKFSFIVNAPGWWCCTAKIAGDPLKGPDGNPAPRELGASFWFYVDAMPIQPEK